MDVLDKLDQELNSYSSEYEDLGGSDANYKLRCKEALTIKEVEKLYFGENDFDPKELLETVADYLLYSFLASDGDDYVYTANTISNMNNLSTAQYEYLKGTYGLYLNLAYLSYVNWFLGSYILTDYIQNKIAVKDLRPTIQKRNFTSVWVEHPEIHKVFVRDLESILTSKYPHENMKLLSNYGSLTIYGQENILGFLPHQQAFKIDTEIGLKSTILQWPELYTGFLYFSSLDEARVDFSPWSMCREFKQYISNQLFSISTHHGKSNQKNKYNFSNTDFVDLYSIYGCVYTDANGYFNKYLIRKARDILTSPNRKKLIKALEVSVDKFKNIVDGSKNSKFPYAHEVLSKLENHFTSKVNRGKAK